MGVHRGLSHRICHGLWPWLPLQLGSLGLRLSMCRWMLLLLLLLLRRRRCLAKHLLAKRAVGAFGVRAHWQLSTLLPRCACAKRVVLDKRAWVPAGICQSAAGGWHQAQKGQRKGCERVPANRAGHALPYLALPRTAGTRCTIREQKSKYIQSTKHRDTRRRTRKRCKAMHALGQQQAMVPAARCRSRNQRRARSAGQLFYPEARSASSACGYCVTHAKCSRPARVRHASQRHRASAQRATRRLLPRVTASVRLIQYSTAFDSNVSSGCHAVSAHCRHSDCATTMFVPVMMPAAPDVGVWPCSQ
jgi:hypothetical protein